MATASSSNRSLHSWTVLPVTDRKLDRESLQEAPCLLKILDISLKQSLRDLVTASHQFNRQPIGSAAITRVQKSLRNRSTHGPRLPPTRDKLVDRLTQSHDPLMFDHRITVEVDCDVGRGRGWNPDNAVSWFELVLSSDYRA